MTEGAPAAGTVIGTVRGAGCTAGRTAWRGGIPTTVRAARSGTVAGAWSAAWTTVTMAEPETGAVAGAWSGAWIVMTMMEPETGAVVGAWSGAWTKITMIEPETGAVVGAWSGAWTMTMGEAEIAATGEAGALTRPTTGTTARRWSTGTGGSPTPATRCPGAASTSVWAAPPPSPEGGRTTKVTSPSESF